MRALPPRLREHALACPDRMNSLHDAFHARPLELIAAGNTIFWEGDPNHAILYLAEGAVRHCRVLRDGRRMIADFSFRGELLGLSPRSTYVFTAEAVTECRVQRLSTARLQALKHRAPLLQMRLDEKRHDEQCRLNDRLLSLLHKGADQRVADFLLDSGRRLCSELRDGSRFTLTIPRADIANHLGLTVETVCRAIARLKRDAILAMAGPSQMVVRNLRALRLRAAEVTHDDEPAEPLMYRPNTGANGHGGLQESYP